MQRRPELLFKELTHPEVVHHLANPLIFHRNFFIKILIKARFDGQELWQRRPVVFFTCKHRVLVRSGEQMTSEKIQNVVSIVKVHLVQHLDPEAPALFVPALQLSSPAPLADGGAQPVLRLHWPDGGNTQNYVLASNYECPL